MARQCLIRKSQYDISETLCCYLSDLCLFCSRVTAICNVYTIYTGVQRLRKMVYAAKLELSYLVHIFYFTLKKLHLSF